MTVAAGSINNRGGHNDHVAGHVKERELLFETIQECFPSFSQTVAEVKKSAGESEKMSEYEVKREQQIRANDQFLYDEGIMTDGAAREHEKKQREIAAEGRAKQKRKRHKVARSKRRLAASSELEMLREGADRRGAVERELREKVAALEAQLLLCTAVP